MSKLRRDLRIALAGACSGLFSVSLFLLGARVVAYYDYLRFREFSHYATRYDTIEDLWWVPVVVWQVVLASLSALLMHRYLPASRTSIFLRWQAIGLVVFAGWGLTVFIAVGMECLIRANLNPIEQTYNMFKFADVAQFVAAVFASNVLYGSAIQAASENLSESTRVSDNEASAQ